VPFPILAGLSTGLLLGLGLAKFLTYSELMRSSMGRWALLVGAVEMSVGLLALLIPNRAFVWRFALTLGLALAAISLFGPRIPHCHCLGAFSEMGSSSRAVFALVILATFSETLRHAPFKHQQLS